MLLCQQSWLRFIKACEANRRFALQAFASSCLFMAGNPVEQEINRIS